jgi:hypothetical protein
MFSLAVAPLTATGDISLMIGSSRLTLASPGADRNDKVEYSMSKIVPERNIICPDCQLASTFRPAVGSPQTIPRDSDIIVASPLIVSKGFHPSRRDFILET